MFIRPMRGARLVLWSLLVILLAGEPVLSQGKSAPKATLSPAQQQRSARADKLYSDGYGRWNPGSYHIALPMMLEALSIRKEVLGPKHPKTLASLRIVGRLYDSMHEFAQARPYLEQALASRKEVLGLKHLDTAESLDDAGLMHSRFADYARARECYEQSLSIRKELLEEKDPSVVYSLQNLGGMHMALRDFREAQRAFELILTIQEEGLQGNAPDNLHVAATLDTLGSVSRGLGDFDKAKDYYERAIKLTKQDELTLLLHRHALAVPLSNLGELLRVMGDPTSARPHLEEALHINRLEYGEKHPGIAHSFYLLGVCLAALDKWQQAGEVTDQARQRIRQHVSQVLPGLSESEQLRFLKTSDEEGFHSALSLGFVARKESNLADLSAAWLVNGKSVAQESLAARSRSARDSRDPALAAILRRLETVRQKMATLVNQGPGRDRGDYQKQLATLEGEEQQLSRQLGQAQLQEVRANPWVQVAEVRQALPKESVLVEIARFRLRNFKAKGQESEWLAPRYVAWLIPPAGEKPVEVVDLGEAVAIEAAVVEFHQEIRAAGKQVVEEGEAEAEALLKKKLEAISRQILAPLLPRVGATPRWIISADAALWLVPWGALPLENGDYALEKHQISYLTSGRDLVTPKAQIRPTARSLVVADPDFNLASRSPAPNATGPRSDSRTSRSGVSAQWSRLPGTAQEAKALVPYLTAYLKTPPDVFLDAKAAEGVIKSAQCPRVAVLSTHGFFLNDQELTKEERERMALRGVAFVPQATSLENPLLRCGLVFSGVNRRGQLPPGVDDGILTGLEIVGTDLRGTELVVLSACETGLGKVNNGEGVAGLRQAFQLAGAEAVVSTLWKIPDQETAELMTEFWQALAQGKNKADALRAAQLSLIRSHRAKEKAAHPLYWAAFTLSGQTRFLDGPLSSATVAPLPATPPAPALIQIEITAVATNVMNGATAVAVANRGQSYRVEGTNGDWYKITIKTAQGPRTGWVHQNQVKRAE